MTAPWRAFRDARYFDLWCVRHSDDREFGAGFHLAPTSPTARARGAAE